MRHTLLTIGLRCDRLLRVLTLAATGLSSVAATLIMALGSIDSLTTAILGAPVPASTELASSFLAVAVFGAMAIAEREKQNIVVDVVSRTFPPRVQRCFEICAALAGAVVFGLLTWRSFVLALDSVAIRETAAAAITFPIYPFKVGAAIALGIAALEYLRSAVRLAFVREPQPAKEEQFSNAGALG